MEPVIPPELWMLWIPPESEKPGCFVRSIDSYPDDLFLVCTSEDDAKLAAESQNEEWSDGWVCVPVRVK